MDKRPLCEVDERVDLKLTCWGFFSSALQPKKRRHKVPLSNGKMTNGVNHLTNGGHSKVALNSDYSVEGLVGEHLLNGHHAGEKINV